MKGNGGGKGVLVGIGELKAVISGFGGSGVALRAGDVSYLISTAV